MDTAMEKIKPINRPSIGEQVCEQMKKYLFDGRWKAGERIPTENELAAAFGVSRLTLREALLRLSSLGFIESRYGGGTYVRGITPGLNMSPIVPIAYLNTKSILDVIEFRIVVEVRTAGLAAMRATPKDMEILEETWSGMDRNKHDPIRFGEEDLGFHLELAKITQNSLLIETINIIRSVLSETMKTAIKHRGTRGLHYHRLMIDAIRKHDDKLTMSIMEEHLTNVYNTLKQNMEAEAANPALPKE
jgi:Transcriptional regulators